MASFLCYYCYQPIKKKHEDENVGFNLTLDDNTSDNTNKTHF
jgi:hypothetical protein